MDGLDLITLVTTAVSERIPWNITSLERMSFSLDDLVALLSSL